VRYAVIPIRDLDGGKTRLAGAIDGDARRLPALAMYHDVLAAASACPSLDGVAAVSDDEEALRVAVAAGAEAIATPVGLNESLTAATRTLSGRGAERLVVVLADLPLVSAGALRRVAEERADLVIVRSRDGGTNALALAPGAIDFHYGPGSAGKHEDVARSAGLAVRVLDEPSLEFDVDTPEDLERLRAGEGLTGVPGEHTRRALERLSHPIGPR
jgi:2-phospho-L-lactate guanylyltransferase